jgi:hypothetical protein
LGRFVLTQVLTARSNDTPYWFLKVPELDLSLVKYNKKLVNSLFLRAEFYNLLDRYPDHLPINTDGSKSETRVACPAMANRLFIQVRLPDLASIFSADLLAIYEVLTLLECAATREQILIVTDSVYFASLG